MPNQFVYKSLIGLGDYSWPISIVETGETHSTRGMPKHIENRSDLRPGAVRQ